MTNKINGLVKQDFNDITSSDVLVVMFDAEGISQGTLIEIGYAHALGKPIIVINTSGSGLHPFINEMKYVEVINEYEAINSIKLLLAL